MNTARLIGVIRCEFVLQWRQRLPLVIGVGLCLVCGSLVLIWHDSPDGILDPVIVTDRAESDGIVSIVTQRAADIAPDQVESLRLKTSTEILVSIEMILHFFVVVLLPIFWADTLPKDTQYGVRELLRSLPLRDGVYIGGKLAASALTVFVGLFIPWAFTGVAWRLLVYPFDVGAYLSMGVLGIAPVGIVAALFGVLLAAGQPTRRRAILIGAGYGGICIVLLMLSGDSRSLSWIDFLNPTLPAILQHYTYSLIMTRLSTSNFQPVSVQQNILSILIVAGEIAALWAWVQWRMRRKQTV